ncbi:MAG: hypothetical protein CSB23_00305 [Deltaproteobacteria bacterium]|nr:MAG: hypothetical protein CSB23_00305 [Deltaproteobacteria bacterium]
MPTGEVPFGRDVWAFLKMDRRRLGFSEKLSSLAVCKQFRDRRRSRFINEETSKRELHLKKPGEKTNSCKIRSIVTSSGTTDPLNNQPFADLLRCSQECIFGYLYCEVKKKSAETVKPPQK